MKILVSAESFGYGPITTGLNIVKELKKYNDFYITCIPWLSIEGMTHPLIDNDYASLSCPRICWDKFHQEGDKILMTLNITVNHCFVDGYPLSLAFKKVQTYFDDVENLLKG